MSGRHNGIDRIDFIDTLHLLRPASAVMPHSSFAEHLLPFPPRGARRGVAARTISGFFLAGALAAGGCAKDAGRWAAEDAARPAPQPAATAPSQVLSLRETVEVLERDLRRNIGPEVRVGLVMTIAPQTRAARVADLDTSGLRVGDPILFIDATGKSIAAGRLVEVRSGGLIADYDPSLVTDGRGVRVEDFAVLNLSPGPDLR